MDFAPHSAREQELRLGRIRRQNDDRRVGRGRKKHLSLILSFFLASFLLRLLEPALLLLPPVLDLDIETFV